jgi:hypothetical protein
MRLRLAKLAGTASAALLVVVALLMFMASAAEATPLFGLMYTGAADPESANGEPTESVEEWNTIQNSGAYYFRMPIHKAATSNGTNWTYYDKVFRAAAERGVTILPVLGPDGSLSPSTGWEPPDTDWQQWVKAVVRRYGYNGQFFQETGIPQRPALAWELMNEENLGWINEEGKFVAYRGKAYGKWALYTGEAIQAASREQAGGSTQVLFGGLLTTVTSESGVPWTVFLKDAYAAAPGLRSVLTGIAFHPYALSATNAAPVEATTKEVNTFVHTSLVVKNTVGLNDLGKTLWITELGWPVQYGGAPANGFEAEVRQARLLKENFNYLKSVPASYNLSAVIWYNYRDSDYKGGWWQYRSGLRDEMGNFRQSWFTFQEETGKPHWPEPMIAFEANTGQLFIDSRVHGGQNTLFGMNTSSPSIGRYAGSYRVAFEANTGTLWITQPWWSGNTNLPIAPGTSPSVTKTEDGVVAYQSNTGYLMTLDDIKGLLNTGQKMAAGTSPSISVTPDRYYHHPATYPVAFQTPSGELRIYENGGVLETGRYMAPGTGPALASLDGIGEGVSPPYAVAYQGTNGQMWLYEPGGVNATTGLGMRAGSSPTITSIAHGGYAIAFVANTGTLWTYVPGGAVVNTGLGVAEGGNPSISAQGDPPYYREFEVAFNATGGSLWTYEPGGWLSNTQYGYLSGTSPGIGPG